MYTLCIAYEIDKVSYIGIQRELIDRERCRLCLSPLNNSFTNKIKLTIKMLVLCT